VALLGFFEGVLGALGDFTEIFVTPVVEFPRDLKFVFLD
jgi:hypothetical protein